MTERRRKDERPTERPNDVDEPGHRKPGKRKIARQQPGATSVGATAQHGQPASTSLPSGMDDTENPSDESSANPR